MSRVVFLGAALVVIASPILAVEEPSICNAFLDAARSSETEDREEEIGWPLWRPMTLGVAEIGEDVAFEVTQVDIDNDGVADDVLRLTSMLRNNLYHEIYVLPHGSLAAQRSISSMSEITNNGKAVKRGAHPLFARYGINATFITLLSMDNRNYVVVQDSELIESSRKVLLTSYTGKPDHGYRPRGKPDVPSVRLEVMCGLEREDPNKPFQPIARENARSG